MNLLYHPDDGLKSKSLSIKFHTNLSIKFTIVPALRVLGNLCTSTDEVTEKVIEAGAIQPITNLLNNPKETIIKESLWCLSNVAAGTVTQIKLLIDAGVILKACELLINHPIPQVKTEATWVVANCAQNP